MLRHSQTPNEKNGNAVGKTIEYRPGGQGTQNLGYTENTANRGYGGIIRETMCTHASVGEPPHPGLAGTPGPRPL